MTELVVVVLSSVVSAVLGAWVAHHWTTRREQVGVTLDLYRRFYEPEMHHARVIAAKELHGSTAPQTFNTLWEVDETVPIYAAMTQVVYFWFELSELANSKMIDPDVARRLFRYPYEYWIPLLKKLHRDTVAEGSTDQDWLSLVDQDDLGWLAAR